MPTPHTPPSPSLPARSPPRPLLHTIALPWFRACLLLAAGLGCIVLIEPAPCDVFSLLAFLIYLAVGLWLRPLPSRTALALGFLALLSHAASLLPAYNLWDSLRYFSITAYLMVSWWLWTSCGLWFGRPFLCRIFQWILAGALLTSAAGILAYYHLIPYSDEFLRWQRVKGLFKDPNVYGPYLIPPILYLVHRLRYQPLRPLPTAFRLASLLLLFLGIIFSFSRGALANLAAGFAFYGALVFFSSGRHKLRILLSVLIASALLAAFLALLVLILQNTDTGNFLADRLRMQSYDEHRFGNQADTLLSSLAHPWGIGPGQSNETFDYAPHNAYIRLLIENGFAGLLFSLLWVAHQLASAWHHWRRETDPVSRDLRALLLACLLSISFESFVIDTFHWRHLFLLLGFAGTAWRPSPPR